ncbi:MAG: alpha-glucosidase C-terminal domain-containing protein [Caldilineaceae bacterium]|nr:alpha-glucosidase C-terminal domain-containing protein [Caldilineaceae bacterium]
MSSLRAQVLGRYAQLLTARRGHAAFHPNAAQRILPGAPTIFAFLSTSATGEPVLCLHNVTSSAQTCCVDLAELGLSASGDWRDLLGEAVHAADGTTLTVTLDGYAVHWLAQV